MHDDSTKVGVEVLRLAQLPAAHIALPPLRLRPERIVRLAVARQLHQIDGDGLSESLQGFLVRKQICERVDVLAGRESANGRSGRVFAGAGGGGGATGFASRTVASASTICSISPVICKRLMIG